MFLQTFQRSYSSSDVVHGQVFLSPSLCLSDPKWLSHTNPWKFPLQELQLHKYVSFQSVSTFCPAVITLLV